jgi:hypothetical protein
MSLVTRRLVAREAEKIFANSPGFNASVTMVGRQAAQRKLASIVSGELPARVIRLSDLLGAGKTFFLQSAINQLSMGGILDERAEYLYRDYRELGDFSPIDDSGVRVLAVDELDRKAGKDDLLRTIEAAKKWQRDERILILTGDYTLRNEELTAVVGDQEPLELEPLDEVLLKKTMTARLEKSLRQIYPDADVEDEAADAADRLIEPEMLRSVLPRTEPSVATFREVLGILQSLASLLPMDDQPCVFTAEMYREAASRDGNRRRPPAQTEFVENLYAEIRRRQRTGEVMPQMQAGEFPWLAGMGEDEVPEYERKVIDPMIRAKLLLPMGVPYAPPSQRRTPGPYLPSVRAFLSAAFLDEQ